MIGDGTGCNHQFCDRAGAIINRDGSILCDPDIDTRFSAGPSPEPSVSPCKRRWALGSER